MTQVTSALPKTTISLRRVVTLVQAIGFLVILLVISLGVYLFIFNAEQTLWQSRQSDFAQTAARLVSDNLEQSALFLDIINELDDSEQFASIVNNIASKYPTIQEVIVLDSDANILAISSTDAPVLSNLFTIQQSNWFLSAKAGNRYLGNLQFSSQNTPYIIISRPLNRANGAIAIRLNMEILNEVVRGIRFGTTGNAYLADSDGQILAHSDFSIVERNTSIGGRQELADALNQSGVNFSAYFNFLGQEVIGSSLQIAGTNWYVFTEVEQEEAYATSGNALIFLGGGLILLFITAILFTINFLQRLVFSRIEKLQVAATQVTAGNLNVQVPIRRMDEIGVLTNAFNIMTTTLHKNTEELLTARDEAIIGKELAQENNRLKSEFLSTMSHELRTPLNAIEGFTGIMLGGMGVDLDMKAKGMVERISTNSKRLIDLVNDFLDISRIESGRMDLVDVPFSPSDLADKWRRQLGVLAEQKDLLFIINVDPALPARLLGDDDALSKIGQNLLSNAFKFTEQGRVMLDLKREGDNWQIIVSDTGIGVPSHAHDYIFDEFRQVDGSSTRRYGGTGLGLAIVQKLVRLMGGTVRLESELGEGSTFTVTLPIKSIETQAITGVLTL
ncbi:MAG: ATP-binding protein [Phototrophicales bacterium]|nr:ATP-binding protein [Phototrophicales bacterium]